jgi:NAD(P)-dependent dehydrogenase (short-subunit alcohol dehydrogenase family)
MLQRLFGLDGKVALVTGGASGIGRDIATGLLGAGAARVYVASRKLAGPEAADDLAADGRCIPLAADLSSVAGCRALAAAVSEREPKLDILVNNAGAAWGAPFESFPEAGWDKIFDLNLKAPFFLTQALVERLAAAGAPDDPARVINVGSIAGEIANGTGTFPYGLSKGALHHATRMLALELAPRRITVNAIAPGRIATKMTAYVTRDQERYDREVAMIPAGRWGQADDMAGAAIYLASRAGAYVTGVTAIVDGGTRLVHPLDQS